MIPTSIIIVTWNNIKATEDCLEHLSKIADEKVTIILVDNGSEEDVHGLLRKFEKKLCLRVQFNETNLGFTKAVNQGIEIADKSTDIILLNNDVIIEDSNWIGKLQNLAYSDATIGIVGCRLVTSKGHLHHAGLHIARDSYWTMELGCDEIDVGQFRINGPREAITFALAYIKRELIDSIGLLDESYFAYFEDVDYCLSARKSGFKVYYLGDLNCYHLQHESTKSDESFFNKLYRASQDIFWKKWSSSDLIQYAHGVIWHSITNISIGYSLSSRYIVKELESAGIDVRYKYIYGRDTVFPMIEPLSNDAFVSGIQSKPMKNYPVQIVYSQGDLFYKNFGEYKIGFTMLEADGLPQEWVQQCNSMNEIWVPSLFNKVTFAHAGVKVPIYAMSLGIDSDHFNPEIKANRVSDKFTFLSVFEWSERKGQELLIKAFQEEFKDTDDTVLVLKVFCPWRFNIELERVKMGIGINDKKIIVLSNVDMPYYQLGTLYRGADCFVLPTRGEGWGMPIMEAMACSIPVIATNWGSQCEFFNNKVGYPLQIKGLVPAITVSPYYAGLQWAEPDYKHLRYLMRYVFEHREEAQEKAYFASEYIIHNYSWNRVIKKMIKRIEEIYENL